MDEAELKRRMDAEVPAGMRAHIARVVALADGLARHHDLDIALARMMAQGHDLVRAVSAPELLARAEERAARGELAISALERERPVLLHGPIGALELRDRFGLDDPRVFHAIWSHTPGHPDYLEEAWAMFVADKIDPRKVERWPALVEVEALAEHSLREAAARYLDLLAERSKAERWTMQPQVALTRATLPDPRMVAIGS
jgi:predicted HD superfamily hydrolase involved in NAD metabolism